MRICLPIAALAASLAAAPGSAATPPGGDAPPPRPFFQTPPGALPTVPELRDAAPMEPDPPLRPDPGPTAGGQPAREAPTRAEILSRLMDRLAAARDPAEARGIAARVEGLWMESGSPTADLVMQRAMDAMGRGRRDVAAALLDKLVEMRPGWAEAWNKRATLRFLEGDDVGSMEDISHALALEPRHFGALSGMGTILARHGEDAAALRTLRRVLSIYPEDDDVRKAVDKLVPSVEGQDL